MRPLYAPACVTFRKNQFTRTFAIVAFMIIATLAQGAQVSEEIARQVAQRFLSENTTAFSSIRTDELQLIHSSADKAFAGAPELVYYRVFNAGENGFVIVAGDDLVLPILAYSSEQNFRPHDIPVNVAKWLEGYKAEIRDAIIQQNDAAEEVTLAWQRLMDGTSDTDRDFMAVDPLLQTSWDQSPHVNAQCPGGSVTGCVATAMAQIMKYHGHPAQGAGFHSYNAPNYGTLSANFGATTYDWAAMPNTVNSANNAVATLMYHCGVSVDMQYSPQVSGAWVIESHSPTTDHNSEYALKTYFGYQPSMQGVKREFYTQAQWMTLLKGDLDAQRPILYAGWGSGGGHAFVCDGYDNNDFFHFNWGWGGAYNGFFSINALDPGGVGTGGGTGGYNSGHQALIGIQPVDTGGGGGTPPNDMGLYNYVTPSAFTLYYGQAFSVSTNIINNGNSDFNGDYCAAVFDDNDNFYGFIETLTNYSLPPGYVYNDDLVFSTNGLFSMLPGTYRVGIFHRPTGGEWVLVSNNGGFTNLPQIQVINPNDIEMNSAIQVSPGMTVTQGDPISVNLNVVNDGFTTFVGEYAVALYNLDGTWAQDVGSLIESTGLPSGYTYLDPFLTFGPVNVTLSPGTYLLAAQHNPNNSGWQLTGSTYFTNPVMVNVIASGESPDQYEVNNTVAQGYTLPVNFSGNNASTNTTGSNLHNETDQDHYKIVLPEGYSYTINARLHDSYNSGNGNTYTVDALFSWSANGTDWSPIYDDIMPQDIALTGGGTIHFHVAPYFTGEIGTYLLQLEIARSGSVGIEEDPLSNVLIHPNPARDQLVIDLNNSTVEMMDMQLFSMQGSLVRSFTPEAAAKQRAVLDLGHMAEGTYLIRIMTNSGILTERIIIAR